MRWDLALVQQKSAGYSFFSRLSLCCVMVVQAVLVQKVERGNTACSWRKSGAPTTSTCYNKKASIIVDQTTQNLKKDTVTLCHSHLVCPLCAPGCLPEARYRAYTFRRMLIVDTAVSVESRTITQGTLQEKKNRKTHCPSTIPPRLPATCSGVSFSSKVWRNAHFPTNADCWCCCQCGK
jgi:hypothetical protein